MYPVTTSGGNMKEIGFVFGVWCVGFITAAALAYLYMRMKG